MLVLDYKKNDKFDIDFTNLDEIKNLPKVNGEKKKVILYLKDGDLTPLYQLLFNYDLFKEWIDIYVPYIPQTSYKELSNITRIILENYPCASIIPFDNSLCCYSILPKWKILGDNAILFLDEKYKNNFRDKYGEPHFSLEYCFTIDKKDDYRFLQYSDCGCASGDWCDTCDGSSGQNWNDYNKVSIIVPFLLKDSEIAEGHNVDLFGNYRVGYINNIAKELKEKYYVKEVNIFASHCFLENINLENRIYTNDIGLIKNWNINKITTTNSTGILEVQNSERLEVVDVCKFFE